MKPISLEARLELNDVLEHLGKVLDITESQYKTIVDSYKAVGDWLSAPDSTLAIYKPVIMPQGSFMLGTMIPASHGKDEIDIDLVCRLTGKNPAWTQYDLKRLVGARLKDHGKYRLMLDEEGRRCWVLNYSGGFKYHIDILPALVDSSYEEVLEKAILSSNTSSSENLAIRITDNHETNFYTATDPGEWPKSNPFGYGVWFHNIAKLDIIKAYALRDAVKPVPAYQKEKLPLQRVVQMLKWHRDQLFKGDKEKPISIIITTLAARAYKKQTDVTSALIEVASNLKSMIEERYDFKRGRHVKWVPNPMNDEENFADKWPDNPNLEEKFNKWVARLNDDVAQLIEQTGLGYHRIQDAMSLPFGPDTVAKAFNNYGDAKRMLREDGGLRMAANTGLIGTMGRTVVRNHNNYGANE